VPAANLDLRSVVVLDAEAHGYQYLPVEGTRSPVAGLAEFTVTPLGAGRFLCGPRLAYADGVGIIRSDYVPYADVRPTTRALGDGVFLIRHGPYAASSYYGSGQCGACPRAELSLHRLDVRRRTLTEAFQLVEVVDNSEEDLDVGMAPDWSTITVFRTHLTDDYVEGEFGPWSSIDHCRRGATYVECGHRSPVPEPAPRTIDYR
jgi:hypothetical protein